MMYHNKYFINHKRCHIALIWMMLLIIFLMIFLNIALNYKYHKYVKGVGYIKKIDGEYYISTYVENLSDIRYQLLIDSHEYPYDIHSISEGYYIVNNKNYYEIVLSAKLDKKLLIENNILDVVFKKEETTLFEEFKKGIKKWLN